MLKSKATTFGLLVLILFLIGLTTKAQNSSNSSKELTQAQLDIIYKQAQGLPNQVEVAIALVEAGELSYVGIKRIDDSTYIRENSRRVFEIGSITKVFTATLLAQQVLDQKLSLSDPIDQYVPIKDSLDINFQHLATHSSGLPRIPPVLVFASLDNPYKDFGEEQLLSYLSDNVELIHQPGATFEYSNLGAGLLGHILERFTKTSFNDLLKQQIFARYQMVNSTTDRSQVQDSLVIGVNDSGGEVPNWDMNVLMGAGGILSTVEDLTSFALAHFDSTDLVLKLTRTPHFKVNEQFSMGLGWSIITTKSGKTLYWHNGGTGGYTSSIILDVQAKNGVVVLSNVSALGQKTQNIIRLAQGLMSSF